jgi:hypothetical protein
MAFPNVISSSAGEWGDLSDQVSCYGANNPISGFKMQIEGNQGEGDDTSANNVRMFCQDGQTLSADVYTNYGEWTQELHCPQGQAVAGIQTRVEAYQGEDGDDTALNGVRLLCRDYHAQQMEVHGYFICEQNNLEAGEDWQNLWSPNYPEEYSHSKHCGVKISSHAGSSVHLHLDNLHLESNYDWVRVYDGANDMATLLAEYTGQWSDEDVHSSGSDMFIVFSSDSYTSYNGFHFQFKSEYHDSSDLHCEQFDGFTDSCSTRKQWLCHYAEWRMNFYGTWMREYMEHNYMGQDTSSMPCNMPEESVYCRNPQMKVCVPSALYNCPVCYCSDHQYMASMSEMRSAWNNDYQVWNRMMKEAKAASGGSNDGTC